MPAVHLLHYGHTVYGLAKKRKALVKVAATFTCQLPKRGLSLRERNKLYPLARRRFSSNAGRSSSALSGSMPHSPNTAANSISTGRVRI